MNPSLLSSRRDAHSLRPNLIAVPFSVCFACSAGHTFRELSRARLLPLVFLCLWWGWPATLAAANAVAPGEFRVEIPTLHCLGFEWKIEGDDNRNASVAVTYRKEGEQLWKDAQPLLRIGEEKVWRAREFLEYWTPRMFAGSILNLEPDTAYECRFVMSDPDGVQGDGTWQLSLRTRSVPQSYNGGRVLHVYPPGFQGPRQEPSFDGLLQAYYGPGLGDWDVVHRRPVQPGDTILVHAGLYKADRFNYVDPHQIPFHGAYVLTVDGTPDKPITIRGAGDGEVIFDGAGVYRLFDVMAADFHIFEGLTIRNTEIAILAGLKDVLGCKGLVVRGCRMEDVGIGVTTQFAGSSGFYIADNIMIGRDDPHRLNGWSNPGIYGPSPLKAYYGVKVYGQGHMICHNYVAYFHDGICLCTHGLPEDDPMHQSVAIDIYNNDVFLMVDDFIEADGGTHNIRVWGNRGFNAAHHGLSAQPVFGGPVYFLRNIVYHVPLGGAIKTGGANPAGVLAYHNTFIAENRNATGVSNAHYRNNLFLGTDDPQRPILRQVNYTRYSTTDYNGYRPNRGDGPQFAWAVPQENLRDYSLTAASLTAYKSLTAFGQATGMERNGVLLDFEIFQRVTPPDPQQPHAIYRPEQMDFQLRKGSAAVDKGVVLPNINDGFVGAAPDLGVLELGQPLPVWGPRPNTIRR